MQGIRVNRSPVLAAALLVFPAAATGTGVVAAHFGADADRLGFGESFGGFADDITRVASGCGGTAGGAGGGGGGAAVGAGDLVLGLLREFAQEILEGHETGGTAENVMADLGLD